MNTEHGTAETRRTSSLAVTSFILAVVGLVPVFVLFTSQIPVWTIAAAFLLGVASLVQIRQSGGRLVGSGFAAAGLITAVVGLVLFVLLQAASVEAQKVSCQSNLKELGTAISLYTDDHHGLYPTPERWYDELYPYVKSKYVFICPAEEENVPSYAMNVGLKGRSMKGVKYPAHTVVLFESVPGKNLAGGPGLLPVKPPHHGEYNILFADGEVKSCTAEELRELMAWSEGYAHEQ